MLLITSKQKASTAASRWIAQYRTHLTPEREEIYKNLLLLGPNPEPAQVTNVIGNSSWTRIACSSCKEETSKAILFPIDDCGYSNFVICETCLENAIYLIQKEK